MHLENNNDYRVMPSRMFKYPYIGTKIIAACGSNYKVDKPLARGIYVLNTMECQDTVMICEAEELTAYRTAAATAIAVDALAREDSDTLGIIGCGEQASYHIKAISKVRQIPFVLLYDINETVAINLATKTQDLRYEVCSNKSTVLHESDIVVTLTPTTKPHIFVNDINFDREMLICAVGGDSDRKTEIHYLVLPLVDHFCDSYDQVAHTGMIDTALNRGILIAPKPPYLKSLGSYLVGEAELDDTKKVKMFLSTGVALEDLALAKLIYEHNKEYSNGCL